MFSKTAFQRQITSARNPRALFFNEDVYVGYIPNGRIEVTAIDPVLGGVFYIFDPPKRDGEVPKFERLNRCMGCHAGSATNFLPGLMTNSVHAQEDGRVIGRAAEHFSGHGAPYRDRWGGWLMTGRTGDLDHLANRLARREDGELKSDSVTDAARLFPPSWLPRGTRSDVATLLVLDHQVGAVNRLIEANYRIRTALLKGPATGPVEKRPLIDEALDEARVEVEKLLRYFLFADEPALPGGLAADPDFAAAFGKNAKRDPQGRSLKELNMSSRLLEFRCSYMIDSTTFRGLPDAFRRMFFAELRDALVQSSHPASTHLPPDERRALFEILSATVQEFAGS